MTADPYFRVRRRVEDRLTRYVGRSVRIGGEADRLILAIRDEAISRQGEVATLELRFLLEESLTEMDQLGKAHA